MPNIPLPLLLLLTQGLLPLGAQNSSVAKILAFWKKVGGKLVAQKGSLSDAGKASVLAAFPDGAGPNFPEKDALLVAVKPPKKDAEKEKDKKRSRSRDDRPRARSRSRHDRRDRR